MDMYWYETRWYCNRNCLAIAILIVVGVVESCAQTEAQAAEKDTVAWLKSRVDWGRTKVHRHEVRV